MALDNSRDAAVRRRAVNCCEYCLLPQALSSTFHQIDHIIAEQHGGKTEAHNLALACLACNHHKGPNLAGIDPKTGKRAWLFNPRLHNWNHHFRWSGAVLVGRTPIGRATVQVLAINLPHRIAQRAALIAEGEFPPRLRRGASILNIRRFAAVAGAELREDFVDVVDHEAGGAVAPEPIGAGRVHAPEMNLVAIVLETAGLEADFA